MFPKNCELNLDRVLSARLPDLQEGRGVEGNLQDDPQHQECQGYGLRYQHQIRGTESEFIKFELRLISENGFQLSA